MFRKIVDGLAIGSFVISIGALAGGLYAWNWIGSEAAQEQIKGMVMDQIKGQMKIPSATGLAVPSKGKLPF